MKRVFRIVLIITFMLVLILWFSTILNTCNKKTTEDTISEELIETEDTSNVFEDLGDDFFENEMESTEDKADENTSDVDIAEESSTPFSTESEDTEAFTDYTGTVTEPAKAPTPTPSANTQGGKYLIVAGSYLVKQNATNMKNKLAGMGYPSEVRNFNYSQYHSVIAGRYNDHGKASTAANELKAKGISCYVHKRQN